MRWRVGACGLALLLAGAGVAGPKLEISPPAPPRTLSAPAAATLAAPATTRAATMAATRPVATRPVTVDLRTPQSCLRSFLEAFRAGDMAAARGCVDTQEPADAEAFEVVLAPLVAEVALYRAAVDRFGVPAAKEFPLDNGLDDLDQKLAAIELLTLTQTGDRATLSLPPSPATRPDAPPARGQEDYPRPVSFVKAGQAWRLRAAELFVKLDPAEIKGMKTAAAGELRLYWDLVGQLRAGRVASMKALLAQMEAGQSEIVGQALLDPDGTGAAAAPASEPASPLTTQPATGPASAPATRANE